MNEDEAANIDSGEVGVNDSSIIVEKGAKLDINIQKGEELLIIENFLPNKFVKVMLPNGTVGYIEKTNLFFEGDSVISDFDDVEIDKDDYDIIGEEFEQDIIQDEDILWEMDNEYYDGEPNVEDMEMDDEYYDGEPNVEDMVESVVSLMKQIAQYLSI